MRKGADERKIIQKLCGAVKMYDKKFNKTFYKYVPKAYVL
jgi:hypothetical protein